LKLQQIRNFCIVAHIDHGKSTLADRLIEVTGTLEKREMKEQVLDTLDLERERGITIKLNAVRMQYTARNGEPYELNLIDTPGHVDFTYEVSRSLAACEGAILVVDASQGIQAQTLSNLFLALDAGLEVIPVLNKIDLPGAEPERRKQEVHELIGVDPDDILLVSAKEGTGIDELLEAIVRRVPAPKGDPGAPLRALIFDSYYDRYRGAIPSVRVVDGEIRPGMHITFGTNDARYEVAEVGYLQLRQVKAPQLTAGEVGYVLANVRSVAETRAGDTIFDAEHHASVALPGYKEVHSMVFAGIYPTDTQQYENLRDALAKLQLNDASLKYEPETSTALGFGFRCGFLGLLHMEIVQERLERESDLDLVTTVPNVEYHVYLADGSMQLIENPSKLWAAATNYKRGSAGLDDARGRGTAGTATPEEILEKTFLKPPSAIVGPEEAIVIPQGAGNIFPELELCVVIGKKARHLTKARAFDAVFGYTIILDVTARSYGSGKGLPGSRCVRKGFETFAPLGPSITTADEIANPHNLLMRLWVNGELRQAAKTDAMVNGVAELVSFLSGVTTLYPGDLIATGNPDAPAFQKELGPGDTLKAEIEGIGSMNLRVT